MRYFLSNFLGSLWYIFYTGVMRFLDQVKIFVKSGNGGGGCVGFRREKFVEFGGPDGGDGGKGGDIVIRAVGGLNTLIDFRYQQHFKAEVGHNGMGRQRTGRGGKNLIIDVPIGTQIFADDKKTLLADMTEKGQELVLLKGGKGGLGNIRFKSSTNQAPRQSTPGESGEEMWIWMQLKLMADVGLVGLPNAGKSSFLRAVTRAKPKVADYPFTTLYPQLGVVGLGYDEFVIADIPGIIEGAHEGIGLGIRFLGHVERCCILLHLIDGSQEDVVNAYQTICHEMKAYGGGLDAKEQILGLNKCDLLTQEEILEKMNALSDVSGARVMPLSGKTGKGTESVLKELLEKVSIARREGIL